MLDGPALLLPSFPDSSDDDAREEDVVEEAAAHFGEGGRRLGRLLLPRAPHALQTLLVRNGEEEESIIKRIS